MRAEDAVHAARAAYEEGVVPGGGTALLNLIPQVQALAASLTGDEQTGAQAVAEALAVPSAADLRKRRTGRERPAGPAHGTEGRFRL